MHWVFISHSADAACYTRGVFSDSDVEPEMNSFLTEKFDSLLDNKSAREMRLRINSMTDQINKALQVRKAFEMNPSLKVTELDLAKLEPEIEIQSRKLCTEK